MTVTKISSN